LNKVPNDLIPVGKIIKPHGIKGQIKFRLFNEESSLLSADSDVWLKEDTDQRLKFFKIFSVYYHSLQPIIKFDNVDDRNKALELRGFTIYMSRSLFPNKKENEIYVVDFIGCTVYDIEKKNIGIVQDVSHFPGNNNVISVKNGEDEFLIPIRMDLIKLFDVKKKKIVMDIIDGLVNEI